MDHLLSRETWLSNELRRLDLRLDLASVIDLLVARRDCDLTNHLGTSRSVIVLHDKDFKLNKKPALCGAGFFVAN